MRLTFEDIDGTASGKIGLLLAHGPSLIRDIGRVFELSSDKSKFVTFTTGDAQVLENAGYEFDLDYWCISNPGFKISDYYQRINKYKNLTFVYADTMDKTSDPSSFLNVNFLPFDQRHFNRKKCTENWQTGDIVHIPNGYYFCCHHEPPEYFHRKTIQEYVRDKSGSHERCTTCDTSALHMLMTAMIAGCSEMYLFGVDLNYNLGYVDRRTRNPDSFEQWIPRITDDFRILNDSCKRMGLKLYNVSENSPISAFVETVKFGL